MTRISGGGLQRNPFGNQTVGAKKTPESVGEQVTDNLFGKKKPRVLDPDDPDTAALMARLHAFRKKLAGLAGDKDGDYDLTLAEGTIAMIDEDGLIYVGKQFLLDNSSQVDLQVGVLAHEIGHRPKRWREYRQSAPVSQEETEDLCRLEETRADYFAGYALAQLGLQCEPLCRFLAEIEDEPHPEYFPAPLRAVTIRDGFEHGQRRAANLQKFFPEFARMRSAKGDLGTG